MSAPQCPALELHMVPQPQHPSPSSLTSCSSLSSFSAPSSTFLLPTYSSSHSFFTLSFYCKHILLLQWEVNALGMSKCVTSKLKSSHLKILTESRKLILSELITVYFFEHSQDYFCEHNIFLVLLQFKWSCLSIYGGDV